MASTRQVLNKQQGSLLIRPFVCWLHNFIPSSQPPLSPCSPLNQLLSTPFLPLHLPGQPWATHLTCTRTSSLLTRQGPCGRQAPRVRRPSEANFHIPVGAGQLLTSLPAPTPTPSQGGQLQAINQPAPGNPSVCFGIKITGRARAVLTSGLQGLAFQLFSGSPAHTVPKVEPINTHPDLGYPGVKQCRNQQAGPFTRHCQADSQVSH